MLQFFEPTQQLVAALVIGTCTLFAAVVNAVAQLRVAREARRRSEPPPAAAGRVRRWVVVGAGFALALGWSATVAHDNAQAAQGGPGQLSVGAGVSSLFGARAAIGDRALTVALVHLQRPLSHDDVVRLLHAHDLRAYAIDLRLPGDAEAWLPIAVELPPAESMPRARLGAVRRAWQEACAYESVMARVGGGDVADAAAPDGDTLALRLVRERAASARRYAERLAEDAAVIHALRVVASAGSASRAAQDSAVARVEVFRYDPGWTASARSEPPSEGCEVVRVRDDAVRVSARP